MKIIQIKVYQMDLHLKGRPRVCAGRGISAAVMDATVVEIITDTGLVGIGEVCPYPKLLAAYAEGVRSAIREFGPALIGKNPLEIEKIRAIMESELPGHAYAKAPIDIALWDLLGKYSNLPVATLLGGGFGKSIELYYAVPAGTPTEMADHVLEMKKSGFKRFQIKVGGNTDEDIERLTHCRKAMESTDLAIADANTGWLSHEAMRVVDAAKEFKYFIEQPCISYEECMKVRKQTTVPFILDECIQSIYDVLRSYKNEDDVIIGLKISKLGGITHMKQCRDLCVSLGFPVKIDTAWGSEITQSALSHVAHSTPEKYRMFVATVSPFNKEQVASGLPDIINGTIRTTTKPGLGLTLNYDVIGKPVFTLPLNDD